MQEDRELLREYREVRQALSELAAIYNDAPVGLGVIGADYRYQRINHRLAELNGVPAEDHIGRTIREVVPKLADIGESLIRKVIETGEPILNLEIEGETAAQPGVRRSFLEHWTPICDDDGKVIAVSIVAEETTPQKRAARALQASEATVRNVLNSMGDAFLVLDKAFRITLVNSEAARISGKAPNELVSQSFWEVWPAAVGTQLETMLRQVMAEKLPGLLEHHYISAALDIWLDVSAYPTSDGIAVFYRDISARKQAEVQLVRSERRLETALRAGNLGVFEVSYRPQLSYYWDSTVRRIWGVGAEDQITDATYWDSLHPEDAPRIRAVGERILSDTAPRRIDSEYRIIRWSDGAVRWVTVALDIICDEHGPYKMIGTIEDITARKDADERLRRSEHRLATALRAGKLGVYEVTLRPQLSIYWDSAVREIFGVGETEEITEQNYWSAIHPDDTARIADLSRQIRSPEGPGHLDFEYRIRRWSDGALRWVRVALDNVSDEHGPYRMIGTLQDITERKAAEEHAHLLMREINHRSKNLLAVVQAIAQQMAKSSDPRTFPQRFAERLAGLASSQDLLVKNYWKGVPLKELIASQLSHYQHLLGSRIRLDGDDVRIAPAAAQNLGMAVHELGTNAAKYGALSGDRGEVVIAWSLAASDGGSDFVLTWTERGGPPVMPPAHRGLGSFIVTRLFQHALSGEVTQDFAPDGVRWAIRATASSILETPAA